jgi:hypothetical protein
MTQSRIDRMRAGPAGNWAVADITVLCREHAIRCRAPTGDGSHWKVSDPTQRDILTIPHRRPVKPVYIRLLVRFIDAVKEARDAKS